MIHLMRYGIVGSLGLALSLGLLAKAFQALGGYPAFGLFVGVVALDIALHRFIKWA
jgi:hypothetical protein